MTGGPGHGPVDTGPVDTGVDVLVTGAGPAGAATALALKLAGCGRVMMADRGARPGFRFGESAMPGVRGPLRRLGLSETLENLGHLPCHGSAAAWGSPALVHKDFVFTGAGHGWHLDRAGFDQWLRDRAMAAGVDARDGVRPVAVAGEAGAWRVRLAGDDGLTVRAGFLVDATGRSAALARHLGARSRRLDGLTAVAATVDAEDGTFLRHRSLVEAAPDGWWYAAGIPDGRCVVMYMTDMDAVRAHRLYRRAELAAPGARTAVVRRHLTLTPDGPAPRVLGAASQRLDTFAGPGWLAAGDAALALDPLTASGINSALADALAAADTVAAWRAGADDAPAHYHDRLETTWQRYLAERHAHYSAETRWPDRPFWQRRHTAPGTAGAAGLPARAVSS